MASPTPEIRAPGPWTHRDISANGIRFHLVEAGSGPLVLMLHGFGQFWWSWRHQLPALAAAGYRAVAVDHRGVGDTDKPPRGYDAFTLAADVAGLVRALGERRAHLVGQGNGGMLAFNAAALHPQQVATVTAIGARHPMTLARASRRGSTDRIVQLVNWASLPVLPERRLVAADGALLERVVRAHAGKAWSATADFAETVGILRRAILIPGAAQGAIEPVRWQARSPLRSDGYRHREALAKPIEAPVLHLAGAQDRFVPLASLAGARDLVSGRYQLEPVPDVGHYPAEEAPEALTGRVIAFVGSTDGAAGRA